MAETRFTQDPVEALWIARALVDRLPQLGESELFAASIPQFISLPGYKFVIATDDSGEPCALGLITFYQAPMIESHVLAVEAMWFRDEAVEDQLWIWAFLAGYAEELEFASLCVAEGSVNTQDALAQLVRAGGFARGDERRYAVRRGEPMLQGTAPGLYSAFTEAAQTGSAFLAQCITIAPLVPVEWSGVTSPDEGLLYRGEGRLTVEGAWELRDYGELVDHLRETGFAPRSTAHAFSGNIPEQILQQGYVNQNTVSLTASFDVAAQYATAGGRRSSGVVVTIDRACLRRYGPVYDSYASMRKYLDWFFSSEFETLVRLVQVLGVLDGGAFLSRCDAATRELVASGRDAFAAPPAWEEYFEREAWAKLRQAGVEHDHLSSLYDAFQGFWRFALGQVGSVDTLTVDPLGGEPDVTTRRVQPLGYYIAFREVEEQLRAVQAGASEAYKRDPGWQTTPFGYVAKTCRDQEFFSSGHVPGECIVDAVVVRPEPG